MFRQTLGVTKNEREGRTLMTPNEFTRLAEERRAMTEQELITDLRRELTDVRTTRSAGTQKTRPVGARPVHLVRGRRFRRDPDRESKSRPRLPLRR
jgi:hypothetical protein